MAKKKKYANKICISLKMCKKFINDMRYSKKFTFFGLNYLYGSKE